MTKLLLTALLIAALSTIAVTGALAAANPSPTGTGQPNQSCEDQPGGPPGIKSTTNGFATTAVNVYAGSQPQNSKNLKSVSQYDVACFQFSTSHP
jgi:hypothetical protein